MGREAVGEETAEGCGGCRCKQAGTHCVGHYEQRRDISHRELCGENVIGSATVIEAKPDKKFDLRG